MDKRETDNTTTLSRWMDAHRGEPGFEDALRRLVSYACVECFRRAVGVVLAPEEALARILTEPKNAILKQYEKLFEIDGIKLDIEPKVLDIIVDTAIKNKLGARGLRSICERIMNDAMFEAPSSRKKVFNLTAAYAKEKLGA